MILRTYVDEVSVCSVCSLVCSFFDGRLFTSTTFDVEQPAKGGEGEREKGREREEGERWGEQHIHVNKEE